MSSSKPTLAELAAVCQPPSLIGRRSAEHWAGRLYMRRISLHVTRRLVSTRWTPNALTLLMIVVGLLAAVVLALPGVVSAVAAAVGIQIYLLLDCVDGEVARWRRTTSAAGVYLDRLGHHVVEAALVVGLGVRAAGGLGASAEAGWVAVGFAGALLVVISKVEGDLVTVARSSAGLPAQIAGDEMSSVASVRRIRGIVARLPLHRLIGAVELSLVAIVAAIADVVLSSLVVTRGLAVGVLAVAAIVTLGHPVTVLTSDRLRP